MTQEDLETVLEAATGWAWERSGTGWAYLEASGDGETSGGEVAPDGEGMPWAAEEGRHVGWYMMPDMEGPETGEAGICAASRALLQAIVDGRVKP